MGIADAITLIIAAFIVGCLFVALRQKNQQQIEKKYIKKDSLVSEWELKFYNDLEKMFGKDYKIQAQINLASIIDKKLQNQSRTELFRNIDLGIFDKKTLKPILLIELNDKTHQEKDRYLRDKQVKEILEESNIPLLTFYSDKPNRYDYVYNRIKRKLEEIQETSNEDEN